MMKDLDLGALRLRLREQLDKEAPAPVVPDDEAFDLDDPENPQAVRMLAMIEAREMAANLLVAGVLHTLSTLEVETGVVMLTMFCMTGRAEQWLSTAPTSAETEVPE